MTKNLRYLITSADEKTWKFDRPVVFLGEWCRVYDRKHIWQNMDAIVAPPYGLSLAQKDADNNEARALEENLIFKVRELLNEYHGVQHGARFWRIVLGHWLHRYVDVMLNRVKTLKLCLQSYEISGTTAYSNIHYTLATTDSYSAIWAFSDDRWNNALSVRILDLLGAGSYVLETIEGLELAGFSFNGLVATRKLKTKILKWVYCQVGKLLSFFARDSDAFIINSYLPKKTEIKLLLTLRQCPQLWTSPKLEVIENLDRTLREKLARKFTSQSDNNLENILSLMLFELLPICYLEGFVSMSKFVKQQPWPKYPKFIFTSNNFDTNDIFKLWTATKVEEGVKYFVGQHGNNYSTNRYDTPTIEELTSDKFITWGWTNGLPQHTPGFIFKTANKKIQSNNEGGLLLIEKNINYRITIWDNFSEFNSYFSEQEYFINALASSVKKELTIRLHPGYKNLNWDEEARWKDFDRSLKIDTGTSSIANLIKKSRLVVHSYDSTSMLETLSNNIPTLAFWQNGFDNLSDEAKPYYKVLLDAGIIHLTPESAAFKVNKVWGDVNAWWGQNEIQKARKEFCDHYARLSDNPIYDLKKILLK